MLANIKKAISNTKSSCIILPIVTITLLSCYLVGIKTAFATISIYCLFTLPGFLVLRPTRINWQQKMSYGVPLGFSVTSLMIIIEAAILGWDMIYLCITYVLILCAILITSRMRINAIENISNKFTYFNKDSHNIPLLILIAISFFSIMAFAAFRNVGKITDYGFAFTELFGHDFILRAADAIAISNSVPSDNYFFAGQKNYNYYILWYMLPASVYNLLQKQANIRDIVAVVCLTNIPFFLLLIYYALRDFLDISETHKDTTKHRKLCLVFILIVFCYSNHWFFFLLKSLSDSSGLGLGTKILSQMNLLSQSWFRDIIFEPHSILSLMMVLLILKLTTAQPSFVRGTVIGVVLAAMALTDTTIFLIFSTSYLVLVFIQIMKRNTCYLFDSSGIIISGALIGIVMFIIQVLTIPEYSNKIIFKPAILVIAALPAFLILNLGVTPIAAYIGIRIMPRRFSIESKQLLLLILPVAMFFMLFVSESLEGNVILRKSMKIIRIPICFYAAYFIYYRVPRLSYKIILAFFIVSLPTCVTDIYAASNVSNKKYTTYVSVSEMDAAAWVRKNTPIDSIVQSSIDYPGYFDYSLTICFGERKSAIGHWKMAYQRYPNIAAINNRVEAINTVFLSNDNELRYKILKALNIDYVFVGPKEQLLYPFCTEKFKNNTLYYKKVFSNGAIQIYKVS